MNIRLSHYELQRAVELYIKDRFPNAKPYSNSIKFKKDFLEDVFSATMGADKDYEYKTIKDLEDILCPFCNSKVKISTGKWANSKRGVTLAKCIGDTCRQLMIIPEDRVPRFIKDIEEGENDENEMAHILSGEGVK